MGERCEKKMKRGVVVDLDGTLLRVNTFKEYIVFSLKEAVKSWQMDIVAALCLWVLLRKCRLIRHEKMKFHILLATLHFMDVSRLQAFVKEWLLPNLNQQVYELCQQYKKDGYYVCLSTAAPKNYVIYLVKHLSFVDSYIATPMPDDCRIEWKENIRELKCRNTIEWLKSQSVSLHTMITDHYDDLPLLLHPKEQNILVNPSTKTLNFIKLEQVSCRVL